MTFARNKNFLSFLSALTIAAVGVGCAAKRIPEHVDSKPFCDLVSHPDTFDGRKLQTTAYYTRGPEHSLMWDPGCVVTDHTTWTRLPDSALDSLSGADRRLFADAVKHGKFIEVTVIGVFHGPKKFDPPPDLPAELWEKVRGTAARHGHMECCRFMMEVEAVREVREGAVGVSAPFDR